MKTPFDPRHKKREKAVKQLFAFSFRRGKKPKNKLAQKVLKHIKKIDKVITQSAPEWPIEQINKVDLAVLRLAVWELTINSKEPPKVIIDEAVELSKSYGSEKSSSFINGVLGTVFKEMKKKK